MYIKPMFDWRELSAGEAKYDDATVPFEPLADPAYASERVVHMVRDMVVTFDSLVSHFDTTALQFNLRVLADLATSAADHIARREKEEA